MMVVSVRAMWWSVVVLVLSVGVHAQDTESAEAENEPLAKFATPCTTPNGDYALCMEINKCHLFANQTITHSHKSYDFVLASSCGPKNSKYPRLCCGRLDNFITQVEKSQSTPAPESLNPFPDQCGRHKINFLNNRIFGGKSAAIGEFPWMARLVHRSKHGYRNYGCSGILIHRKFILTAAHCLSQKILEPLGPVYQIVLGRHDFDKEKDCTEGLQSFCADPPVHVATGKPVVYSGYSNSSDHNNDLALIPLKEPVRFTDFIQPICLLESATTVSSMWLAGWGATEEENSSNVKLKVEVPRVSFKACTDKYQTINMHIHKRNQLCAGGIAGKDSCTGDSGGPLMVEIDGIWYAEGIVSFGVGCGRAGWPGVYTNIPRYVDWIKNTINRKLENKMRKRLAAGG